MKKLPLMGQKTQTSNQPGVPYLKAIKLIDKHAKKRQSGIVPFSEARKVLSWLFHFDREESRKFIIELRKLGLVSYHPYHGIKILVGGASEQYSGAA
jgi:hypothetical protein